MRLQGWVSYMNALRFALNAESSIRVGLCGCAWMWTCYDLDMLRICGIGLGTMCTIPRYSGKISWKGATPIDGCVAAKLSLIHI